ncbi:MAG: iron-containing alcohol dehydrogenase [Planctomycetota bacterium]
MFENVARIDPRDIAGINEQIGSWAVGGEATFPVGIQQVLIEEDAFDGLADLVVSMSGGGRVLMVVDRTEMRRGGEDLKQLVEERLARVVPINVRRLPDDPAGEVHAELELAEQLSGELGNYSAAVSVGSGSITDVVKYARQLLLDGGSGELPIISFPTAASVTAYSAALSVITVEGVKRTFSSLAPDAIVCDLRTLVDAPVMMTQAGFGDVLARSVAYGDWHIAYHLGMDVGFSLVPGKLLGRAESAMLKVAEEVSRADLIGIRAVTDAVLLAGMAMSIVQQTAPISGWEHVISHYLDLAAGYEGRALALHGGQVGVGTLIAARAYERTWGDLDLDRICAETTDAEVHNYRQKIARVFLDYDDSGKLAGEVWRDFEKKIKLWRSGVDVRRRFAARKRGGEFEEFIGNSVRSSGEISEALDRAGAPQRFGDLDKPVSWETAYSAIRYGHLIRKRFTLGDLLDWSGWLGDETAKTLLDEAEAV